MKRVMIESPYRGDIVANKRYLSECIDDSIRRGESPFASHGFYTNFIDDEIKDERWLGIVCGVAWGSVSDCIAVYTDRGITSGMSYSINKYKSMGKRIEYRSLWSE